MRAVFVVGTGRSGTHFTCRTLGGFPTMLDPLRGHEDSKLLRKIALAAVHHQSFPSHAIEYYKSIEKRIPPNRIFLDQHHPNLFFSETLDSIFEDAIYLCPRRPMVQIVASMLQHEGILSWIEYAKKSPIESSRTSSISVLSGKVEYKGDGDTVPFPNQFLGVESREQLFELDKYLLCALRVLAHYRLMISLTRWDRRFRFISYERLVETPEKELCSVFSNEERELLGDFTLYNVGDLAPLDKYRSILTKSQIEHLNQLDGSLV